MKKNWIKLITFCCIITIITCCLNFFVFSINPQTIYGYFYYQAPNSLDIVSIGNSTVKDGINPCEAWKNYQVTSYNVCAGPTHPEVICIAINEVARTQRPKVVYVDLNGLTYQSKSIKDSYVKSYIKSMPNGSVKNELIKKYNLHFEDDEDLFKGHNNFRNPDWWTSIFHGDKEYLKGFTPLYEVQKQVPYELDDSTVLDLPEDGMYYLNKIIETCKKYPDITFVFGKMPRILNASIVNETYKLRSAIPILNENGYDYIEWEDYIDEIGLDPTTDLKDQHHMNIYGSIKFTKFYIEYLDAHYSICGATHSNSVKKDFDEAYNKYFSNVLPK